MSPCGTEPDRDKHKCETERHGKRKHKISNKTESVVANWAGEARDASGLGEGLQRTETKNRVIIIVRAIHVLLGLARRGRVRVFLGVNSWLVCHSLLEWKLQIRIKVIWRCCHSSCLPC